MELTWIAIAASLLMGASALLIFIWAVRFHQFRDFEDVKYQVFWSDLAEQEEASGTSGESVVSGGSVVSGVSGVSGVSVVSGVSKVNPANTRAARLTPPTPPTPLLHEEQKNEFSTKSK
jgi:cbb3-type cytochrome oxidase maturation protein